MSGTYAVFSNPWGWSAVSPDGTAIALTESLSAAVQVANEHADRPLEWSWSNDWLRVEGQ